MIFLGIGSNLDSKFGNRFSNINKAINFILNEKIPKVVESIPGWEHYIKNIGNSDLIVLLWSNEIFDVNKPDTYRT